MKYSYECVGDNVNSNDKIIIICQQHGKFKQRVSGHLCGQGCPKCALKSPNRYGNNYTIINFITNALKIHGDKYDYSKSQYDGSNQKINIICKQHGEFKQRASAHLDDQGCPKCIPSMLKTTNEFINNSIKIHGDRYDYSLVNYIGVRIPVIIICKKHGKFKQTPISHLNRHGCKKCAHEIDKAVNLSNTADFIKKSIIKHKSRYNYELTKYNHSKEIVIITCKKHGEFKQKPNYHLCGNGCPKCAGTHLQNEVYEFIKQHDNNAVFNDKKIIKPLEIDIYLPNLKFGIEVNGQYYHSYNHRENPDERNYHLNKLKASLNANINLIQITEYEWMNKREIVKSMILNKFKKNKRIFARHCEIYHPNNKEYYEFMNKNHLQGGRYSKIIIGLRYNNKPTMMISLHEHKMYEWEITRAATILEHIIVGGFSKLLSHFIKQYKPKSIMTYANRRYSNGNAYKKLGFELIGTTKPNYCYVKREKLFSRQQFQKHKLHKKLQNYDPLLSESQNMFNNKYRRMWDCGNLKYLLNTYLKA